MVFRKFYLGIFLTVSTILLTGCPAPALDPGDCNLDFFVEERGNLSPLKDNFTVGEILTMEINMPSEVENAVGDKFNLYEKFDKETVSVNGIGISLGEFLDGNQFNILKGELSEDFRIDLQFNEASGYYEFLCEIELLREGEYRFNNLFSTFSIQFGNDEDNCSNNIKISSNFIKNEDFEPGFFTVIPIEQ